MSSFLKKRLWYRYLPVNFAKFLRTPFLTEHLLVTASVFYKRITNHFIKKLWFLLRAVFLCKIDFVNEVY